MIYFGVDPTSIVAEMAGSFGATASGFFFAAFAMARLSAGLPDQQIKASSTSEARLGARKQNIRS